MLTKIPRDKNLEYATLRDELATSKILRKYIIHGSLSILARHATFFDISKYICMNKHNRVLRNYYPKFPTLFFCRVSRECATIYIDINNSLSIYTRKYVAKVSRDISRDTWKVASRRDIFHHKHLALIGGTV